MVDVAPAKDISINDRETFKTIMRKRTSLIDNKRTLKVLRHIERKKLMKRLHRLDKVLPNQIKDISQLKGIILAFALIAKKKFNRAKWNDN